MDIKVKSLYLKLSPTKMRPILFGIRNKSFDQAKTFLTFTNKKGAIMALSLLNSAAAIAKENDLEIDKMQVKSVYCNEGPRLRRRKARSKGMAYAITKRMCHLTIVLGAMEMPVIKEKEADKKENIKETVAKENKGKKQAASAK